MILRSCYSDTPKPYEWGKKFIVPINIEKVTQLDADGNEKEVYLADVIEGVEKLTVTGIVKAAVAAEFSEDDVNYVMVHLGDTSDEKVKVYTEFVANITKYAKAAGYTD